MRITAAHVMSIVGEYYQVGAKDMISHSRHHPMTWHRFMAWHLTKIHCSHATLHSIGRHYGGRDHTSISYGLRKIAVVINRGGKWADDFNLLDRMLTAIASGKDIPRVGAAGRIARAHEIRLTRAILKAELEVLEGEMECGARYNFIASSEERRAA